MAFQLIGQPVTINNYTGDMKPTLIAKYVCDTPSDLPARVQSDYIVGLGSSAHVISNAGEYMIQSDGSWQLQVAGTVTYTKTEIDNLLADSVIDWFRVGTIIERGENVDNLTELGIYNVPSNSDAEYISGLPATYGGRLEVFATIDDESYCKQMYFCNDDQGLIYTRRKLSDGWSVWILLTPLNVCFSVGNEIVSNSDNPYDLNNLQKIGRYYFGGTAATTMLNRPSNMPAWGGEIIVERVQLTNRYRQTIYLNSNAHTGKMWVRHAYSGTAPNLSWSAWYLFEATQV